jgi:hypothetical protein
MKANLHIVEFVPERNEDEYPYKVGDHVRLIEIENMPGHCAVITREGHVVWATTLMASECYRRMRPKGVRIVWPIFPNFRSAPEIQV